MNSVYQSEAPYAWSSPLVAAATGVFAPDFLSRQLALQGEGEFAPYADWHFTNNEGQKAFFSPRHYPQALALAQRLLAEDKPELIGMASNDVAILNWLFAQNGFPNMKLDPVGPDGMAIATILRLLRHFPEVVQKGYSLNETMPHEAFRFPRGTFQVYNLDQNLLIEIGFPNGD